MTGRVRMLRSKGKGTLQFVIGWVTLVVGIAIDPRYTSASRHIQSTVLAAIFTPVIVYALCWVLGGSRQNREQNP